MRAFLWRVVVFFYLIAVGALLAVTLAALNGWRP